jgi:hypothetical protein
MSRCRYSVGSVLGQDETVPVFCVRDDSVFVWDRAGSNPDFMSKSLHVLCKVDCECPPRKADVNVTPCLKVSREIFVSFHFSSHFPFLMINTMVR